jgi:probable biosynthetic protein (TIGR04098 family)
MSVAALWTAVPEVRGTDTLCRREVVRPGMCGHNSLFVGQVGDWTWDAVSALCGVDALRATDPSGAPTYLSFYYYRVRGSRRFHLRTPSFGDRLRVTSRLFDFGSESILTLHRIIPDGTGGGPEGNDGIDVDEFYRFADPDCLYVENFNRWISRGTARSNENLVRASPVGFRHRHLPDLPERYSPRAACHRARTELSFLDPAGYRPEGPQWTVDYEVDISRDLNGVGLLYFASYFALVDWALLRFWRWLGRTDAAFLDRVVLDQQLCCLGNADGGRVVTATLRRWRPVAVAPPGTAADPGAAADGATEAFDVVLRERDGGRILAVCTLHLALGEGR